MRFGVNYTPRQGWFYHWLDFSPAETARDLDTIAELGVDHIRIFPLWPLIQPHRGLIRPAALHDVEQVLELAQQRGLDVCVDGLQGHLSSFDFLPAWLTSWHRRNMFTDPDVIASTATYLTALATACAAHPNLMALTVGNEVNQFTGAVHPDPFPVTQDEAGAWTRTMVEALRAGAPGVPVVHACYDATWYDPAQPFTPTHAATIGDMTVVHSWVFNGTAQMYGADSTETARHARYLVELARAFQTDPHRLVWAQEVGTPRTVIPGRHAREFMRATFSSLANASDMFALTWWASHDVDPALADFPPVEYSLGLIDHNGCTKPAGRVFRRLIDLNHSRGELPELKEPTLVLDLNKVGGRAALAPGGVFWQTYMEVARYGYHPSIVLEGDHHA